MNSDVKKIFVNTVRGSRCVSNNYITEGTYTNNVLGHGK